MESLPTLIMLKSAVLEAILTRLDSELETLTRGARASFAAATDPDSKAENKYDTRTLEASYVARGQAQRVTEVQAARHAYASLPMTAFETIRPGSLVEIEVAGHSDHYFLGPAEGGLEIIVDGTEILLITPASPLGARLMGKAAGDRIGLPSGHLATIKNIG